MQRILCVGINVEMLAIRCAVLEASGYAAEFTTLANVQDILQRWKFDLVILPTMLSEKEKKHIRTVVPSETQALVLDRLVFPRELLRLVAEAFAE